MLNNDLQTSGKAGEQDRRDSHAPGNRFLGRVVACSGSRATIAAVAEAGGTDLTELWSVGRLISISVGRNRVVALVYSMNTGSHAWGEGEDNYFRIETELLGEVRVEEDGRELADGQTGFARLHQQCNPLTIEPAKEPHIAGAMAANQATQFEQP